MLTVSLPDAPITKSSAIYVSCPRRRHTVLAMLAVFWSVWTSASVFKPCLWTHRVNLVRKQPSITSFKTSFDKKKVSCQELCPSSCSSKSADVVCDTERRVVLRLTSAREPLLHVHVSVVSLQQLPICPPWCRNTSPQCGSTSTPLS